MKKMILNIQFFVLSIFISFCVADETLGPADISIERVEQCENPEIYPHEMPLQMNKLNRTHAGYTGCIDFPDDMDNSTSLNLTMAKWGDGGWKPNALNYYSAGICDVLKKNVEGVWDAVMQAAGREDGSCPVQKSKYCLEKFVIDLEGAFPSMLYGKFRADAIFMWNNEPFLCFRVFINSDPIKGPPPAKGPPPPKGGPPRGGPPKGGAPPQG